MPVGFMDTAGMVLPLFALILVGWSAGYLRLLPDAAAESLSDYVFSIAVPVLIFNAVTGPGGGFDQSPWTYWLAYFAGAFAVFAVGMASTIRIWKRTWVDGAIQGVASGHSNVVFVGVPIILAAYGADSRTPLYMLLALHMPVMTIAAMLVAEAETLSWNSIRRALFSIARNPIVLGIVAGATAHAVGYRPAGGLATALDLIAGSTTACGLIALGLTLRRAGALAALPQVVALSVLKLLVHPLLVLAICIVLGVDPLWTKVAVVFAAMPCGMNAFLLAQKYRRPAVVSAAAITLSTLISLPTIALWLLLLDTPGIVLPISQQAMSAPMGAP